jgi:hypothetical protein
VLLARTLKDVDYCSPDLSAHDMPLRSLYFPLAPTGAGGSLTAPRGRKL